MNKNKVKYIVLIIVILIIGFIIFINLFNRKNNKTINSCGDNAFFEYNHSTNTVTIHGTGTVDLTGDWKFKDDMIDRGSSPGNLDYQKVGQLIFPAETEKIIISEGITNIRSKSGEAGTNLVSGGTYLNLKEIVLPNSLQEIGIGAFSNQTKLEKINIPNSITKIPDYAFYNCENLNTVTLPETIKIIGNYSFSKCNKLYNINFPTSIRIIEEYAFSECATLSEVKLQNIRYIGKNSFQKCYNLKNVELNGDITELFSYTFDVCLNLQHVKLTDTIKFIANDAFRNCKMLETDNLFKDIEITHHRNWNHNEALQELRKLEEQVMLEN